MCACAYTHDTHIFSFIFIQNISILFENERGWGFSLYNVFILVSSICLHECWLVSSAMDSGHSGPEGVGKIVHTGELASGWFTHGSSEFGISSSQGMPPA